MNERFINNTFDRHSPKTLPEKTAQIQQLMPVKKQQIVDFYTHLAANGSYNVFD